MQWAFALFLAALGPAEVAADHWAVIVAGSNGFFNYRHQADACHAYHILIRRGFHPDRVITMIYDDVANDSMNPIPGKLFNYPWKNMSEAVDVYKDCKIDYKGEQVNPNTFIAVLEGDSEAAGGGKVLKSTADDNVFVNFVDHGAVGLIAFPDGVEPGVLHAKKLVKILKQMHSKGMYKQMLFYLETCNSGSMFEGLLPEDLPVYALTAANAEESSWGTFCGDDGVVGDVNIGSCLGDLFSVNWMMDTETQSADNNESLKDQFEVVKTKTNKSHVMQYGQVLKFDDEPISDFQSGGGGSGNEFKRQPAVKYGREAKSFQNFKARDASLEQKVYYYLRKQSSEALEMLHKEIALRKEAQELGERIRTQVASRLSLSASSLNNKFAWTPEVLDCHERAVERFDATCRFTEHRLPLSDVLFKMCQGLYHSSDRSSNGAAIITDAIEQACPNRAAEIWTLAI